MDALTRWLAPFFPGWAANRVHARARLAAATRLYDALKASPYRPRRGTPASGDAVMDAAKNRMREYARWLDENHDLAVGILDDLVTNVVGPGVGIEPSVKTNAGETLPAVDARLRELWNYFWEQPEVTGQFSGPELERIVCRSWLRDGEIFLKHISKDNAPFNTDIPYALEILESDFVPYDLFDAKAGVVHGVQKNAWGTPLGYWVQKEHPGNTVAVFQRSASSLVWIPAENMTHLKFTRRLHQTRGVSIFHAVMSRLDDIKDYEESERVAARVSAALCAYIQKSADYAGTDAYDAVTGARTFEMAPGMIFDTLLPGESVGTIKTDRPNASLAEFRDSQMRAVAAGTGTRFSSVSRNYNGTYSAQRQELVEGGAQYRQMFSTLKFRFYLPIWRRFVDAALAAGELSLPRNVKQSTLYYPELRPPQLPWIDPLKEMKAATEAVQNGFKSRYQIIRDLGGDPSAVDAQAAADTFVPPGASTVASTAPDDQEDAAADDTEDAA